MCSRYLPVKLSSFSSVRSMLLFVLFIPPLLSGSLCKLLLFFCHILIVSQKLRNPVHKGLGGLCDPSEIRTHVQGLRALRSARLSYRIRCWSLTLGRGYDGVRIGQPILLQNPNNK